MDLKKIKILFGIIIGVLCCCSVFAIECSNSQICNCGNTLISNKFLTYADSFDSCLGNGLIINSNDIILDCGNSSINGVNIGSLGILIENAQNITIQNCIFDNFYNGININSSKNIIIKNSRIENMSGAGINILNSKDISIFNSTIINSWDGIFLKYSSNVYIFQNNITLSKVDGVQIYDECYNIKIYNNTLLNNDGHAIAPVTCNNQIEDLSNIGGNGKLIKVVANTENIILNDISEFSEVLFCNVKYSKISNGDLDNGEYKTDGILLVNSDNNQIENINFNNVRTGIYLYNSNNNYGNDLKFGDNDFGIRLMHNSLNNVFENLYYNVLSGVLIRAENSYANQFNNVHIDNFNYNFKNTFDMNVSISENKLNFEGNFELKENNINNINWFLWGGIIFLFVILGIFLFKKLHTKSYKN